MFDICHPTYYHMSQLGCNDQVKLTTAFYVYMELCEVKRYWDVKYKYCEPLQLFYLEAQKSKNTKSMTFIPWSAYQNLSLDLISSIQQELEVEKFTFVFKEGDTTSVYYSISSGTVKPLAPEDGKLIREKMKRKLQLDNEINRNAANLYERALLLENGEMEIVKKIEGENDMTKVKICTDFHLPVKMDNIPKEELELISDDKHGDFSDANSYKTSENSKTEKNGVGWGDRDWKDDESNPKIINIETEKCSNEHDSEFDENSQSADDFRDEL